MSHFYDQAPQAAWGAHRRRRILTGLLTALAALLLAAPAAVAQTGIGTATPNAKAALDISATDKGLLIPRMDSASRAAITTPPDGLMVFQNDGRKGFWYALGGTWLYLPNKTQSGDNLGNHTATQNLNLAANALTGTGTSIGGVGIGITGWGGLNMGQGTTGNNVAIGYDAGRVFSTGARNLLVGYQAGRLITTANDNTLIGFRAGAGTNSGGENLFVGSFAGITNTTGGRNVYLGTSSGQNSTSSQNTFVGYQAGSINTTGSNNWAFGYNAGPGVNGLTNAGALGYNAVVMQSNSLVLGGIGGDAVKVGIGTPTPAATLEVSGATSTVKLEGLAGTGTRVVTADATGNLSTTTTTSLADNLGNHTATQNLNLGSNTLVGNGGTTGLQISSNGRLLTTADNLIAGKNAGNGSLTGINNTMLGAQTGLASTSGGANTFMGSGAGMAVTSGGGNTFIGVQAGFSTTTSNANVAVGNLSGATNVTGASVTTLGAGADVIGTALTNATAVGANAKVSQSNSLVLGNNVNVGIGTTAPTATLEVGGSASTVKLGGLAGTGTRVVTADASGSLSTVTTASLADNLGNHTATTNLNLGANLLVGNGGSQGLAITSTGKVGLGVTNPGAGFAQLGNTSVNMLGTDGQGGNFTSGAGSLAWAMNTSGFAGLFYNGSTLASGNGLAVKVDGTNASASVLDVSKGAQATTGASLLMVKASGNVGIGTNNPQATLDVVGNAKVSGTATATTYTFPNNGDDSGPVMTTRLVPATQGGVNPTRQSELILFHSNDGTTNLGGPDQITLRAPQLSFQTYNNTAVSSITDDAGYNARLTIAPTGAVLVGSLVGTDTRMVTADATGTLSSQALPVDTDTDAQQLTKSGNTISLTNGGSVTDDDNQNLTLSGASLSISGGTGITLPDADATNELQTISKTGNVVTLSNGGGSFTDTDTDTDAQTLTISGGNLTISGGNSVALTSLDAQQLSKSGSTITLTNGGSVTDADNQNLSSSSSGSQRTISISGGTGTVIDVADADADATNELQTIDKTGSTVTLSNGGGSFTDSDAQQLTKTGSTISLTSGGSVTDSDNQTLSVSGQTLVISGGNSVTVPVVSATNGLSLSTGAVGLGGTLTAATTIANGGNNLGITGTGNVGIGTASPATKLDVAGGFKLGTNGTTLAAVIKATVTANVPNVAAGGTQTVTFTVTNAATGATAFVSPGAALANGLVIQYARVSAANTVEVKFHNPTAADINPPALDYHLTVLQ